jgi:hypothetical protein
MSPTEITRIETSVTTHLTDPTPYAATLWQDQPELFERLRRRLASYAPNTQFALAADWRMWRAWCAANNREPFPARPKDSSAAIPRRHRDFAK